jgi:hypothetical protein
MRTADGRQRHAFIGLGFRERPEAYDFQAALHDHTKYPLFITWNMIYRPIIFKNTIFSYAVAQWIGVVCGI